MEGDLETPNSERSVVLISQLGEVEGVRVRAEKRFLKDLLYFCPLRIRWVEAYMKEEWRDFSLGRQFVAAQYAVNCSFPIGIKVRECRGSFQWPPMCQGHFVPSVGHLIGINKL